jgi:hypothetical protein
MNEKVARKRNLVHKNKILLLNPAAENLMGLLVPVIFKKVFSSCEMAEQVFQW